MRRNLHESALGEADDRIDEAEEAWDEFRDSSPDVRVAAESRSVQLAPAAIAYALAHAFAPELAIPAAIFAGIAGVQSLIGESLVESCVFYAIVTGSAWAAVRFVPWLEGSLSTPLTDKSCSAASVRTRLGCLASGPKPNEAIFGVATRIGPQRSESAGAARMTRGITIRTRGQGLHDITKDIQAAVAETGVDDGLCTILIQHTSASLTIQENADPSARRDLEVWLNRLVSENDPIYTHTVEGPDDMPSHIKAALTATTLSIPIADGRLGLGTWQGIYLWEHRHRGSNRNCLVHVS